MKYVSVCSGIEAATVAWEPLGWEPLAFAEIEPFPSAVLAHHWSHVRNLGDFTRIQRADLDADTDLLVGGTPCQSFSVAGLRGGMADARGNLALEYLALAGRLRARWLVWENVPGVLSSNGGRDFGSFLGGLAELGYGFAWRVLDAQYAGLAQRRERVFLVGHLGDWRRAAAVLFERASLQGHPAPRREAGQGVAGCLESRTDGGGFPGTDGACAGHVVACPLTGNPYGDHESRESLLIPDVAGCLQERDAKGADSDTKPGHLLPVPILEAGKRCGQKASMRDGLGVGAPGDPMFTLQASAQHAIAFNGRMDPVHGPVAGALDTKPGHLVPVSFDWQAGDGGKDASFRGASRSYICDKPGRTRALNSCKTLAVAVPVAFHENQRAELTTSETAGSLKVGGGKPGQGYPAVAVPVAFQEAQTGVREHAEAGTLRANGPGHDPVGTRLRIGMSVRRLTPRECERLQGFPDDYTLVPYRGKPAKDGPRYKALGNSMAVPCMRWIGERIAAVDHPNP